MYIFIRICGGGEITGKLNFSLLYLLYLSSDQSVTVAVIETKSEASSCETDPPNLIHFRAISQQHKWIIIGDS